MNFFQAVRTHCLRSETEGKGYHPIGSDTLPQQEPVRFSVQNTFGFPAAPIAKITPPEKEGDPYNIQVTFMGLTGPMGVLPDHYTALIISRLHAKDSALADFFDLFFNHRAISLYFRAWEKYRLYLSAENLHHNILEKLLASFIGYGTTGLQNRHSISDKTIISYAGLFAQAPHSAINLEMMLSDYLRIPIEVQQFQTRWLYLTSHNLGQLRNPYGKGPYANSQHPPIKLGETALLGKRAKDVQTKFRIRVGAVHYPQFLQLYPGGEQALSLAELAKIFAGYHLHFDVQLVLKKEEVPFCQLRRKDPLRLGRNTWLKSREFTQDAEAAIFSDQRLMRRLKDPNSITGWSPEGK